MREEEKQDREIGRDKSTLFEMLRLTCWTKLMKTAKSLSLTPNSRTIIVPDCSYIVSYVLEAENSLDTEMKPLSFPTP